MCEKKTVTYLYESTQQVWYISELFVGKKILTMVLEKIQLVHGWDMIHADNAVHVMHDFIAHNIEKGGKATVNLLIHIN